MFADGGNTKVILFSAMVGGVIALTQASGGVAGFVSWVSSRRFVQTRRHAFLLSWFLGVVIFVESSMTALVNGSVCRPIFDKFKISREKLAYLCDATSAPICILIPLNAWGAYIVRLLEKEGYQEPVATLAATMPSTCMQFLLCCYHSYRLDCARLWADEASGAGGVETGKVVADDASPMLGDELTGSAIEGQGPVSALLPIADCGHGRHDACRPLYHWSGRSHERLWFHIGFLSVCLACSLVLFVCTSGHAQYGWSQTPYLPVWATCYLRLS